MSLDVRIVTPWFAHFSGGAEVAARRYGQELAARGLSVELCATCCQSPFHDWWSDQLPAGEERSGALTVRRFPVDKDNAETYRALLGRELQGETLSDEDYHTLARSSCNSQALLDYAEANPARVTIALPYTQGLTMSAAERLGSALTVMPCFHDEAQIYWPSTRTMLEKAGGCAFLADEEKHLAIAVHGNAVGRKLVESPVVGLGVNPPEAPGALPVAIDGPYIVYVGRKDAGKGLPMLLQWMKELEPAYPKLKLALVGGGGPLPGLDDPRVVDLGFVEPAQKSAAIAGALALINPSAMESFSIVIFEAWLLGVPVIVNKASAVTTAFAAACEGGFAVSSAAELADALDALGDETTRSAMGRRGRDFARAETDWTAVANRFIEGMGL